MVPQGSGSRHARVVRACSEGLPPGPWTGFQNQGQSHYTRGAGSQRLRRWQPCETQPSRKDTPAEGPCTPIPRPPLLPGSPATLTGPPFSVLGQKGNKCTRMGGGTRPAGEKEWGVGAKGRVGHCHNQPFNRTWSLSCADLTLVRLKVTQKHPQE